MHIWGKRLPCIKLRPKMKTYLYGLLGCILAVDFRREEELLTPWCGPLEHRRGLDHLQSGEI